MLLKEEQLPLEAIIPDLKVHNRKQAYQEICKIAGYATRITPIQLFDKLTAQEEESPAAVGDGIAIPHICIEGLAEPYMLFARLEKAIDFDAPDAEPVDLIFMILSPVDDGPYHLRRLAAISRMLRNEQLRANLRGTSDSETLYSLLRDPDYRRLAA